MLWPKVFTSFYLQSSFSIIQPGYASKGRTVFILREDLLLPSNRMQRLRTINSHVPQVDLLQLPTNIRPYIWCIVLPCPHTARQTQGRTWLRRAGGSQLVIQLTSSNRDLSN